MSERKRCFPPVVDARTRVLILGSLPGDASLAQQQYYAHPQNKLWELLGSVININLRAMRYEHRLAALLAQGIGLWDVLAEAERPGSLDAAIREQTPNSLLDLLPTLPELRAVGFNGGTSAKHGRRQLQQLDQQLVLIDLPSSSPAYTLSFESKLSAWAALGIHLSP